jgi:hypothetical protein
MQRTVIVIAVVVVLVGFLGFIVLPWMQQKLFGESSPVTLTVLTACIDNDVEVPGTKGQTVPKIVAEVEISFKYGTAPDSIHELSVHDDDDKVVDVNWGRSEPDKRDNESKGKTTLTVKEAFFPTDFKQGHLWDKDKRLCYFRLPAVTGNCAPK